MALLFAQPFCLSLLPSLLLPFLTSASTLVNKPLDRKFQLHIRAISLARICAILQSYGKRCWRCLPRLLRPSTFMGSDRHKKISLAYNDVGMTARSATIVAMVEGFRPMGEFLYD